jgi:hypothetical protein
MVNALPTASPGPRSWLLLLLILVGTGCGGTDRATDRDRGASPSPDSLYQAAIADARTATPSDITTTLTPLAPYNDDLVWQDRRDSTRRVLVVTWGGSDTLPSATPGDTVTTDADVWVTAAPQLQRFCRGLDRSGDALDLRLAQRLGLPPDVDYDRVVELWVRPQDLVRPCPDPEVSDRECGLRAPVPARHAQVSDAQQTWYRELKATSYGPDGYPFTGLGYTYDWHPATDDVGPSEFVLRPGRPAVVHDVQSTAAYCGAR